MKNFFFLLLMLVIASASATGQMSKNHAADAAPTLIKLTQTDGQYDTQELTLTPGDYIFEVTNLEVAKDLGFYLQNATEAQVANSGLQALIGKGQTSRTGVVTLAEGSYQYSCPLNPTPHYTVNVVGAKQETMKAETMKANKTMKAHDGPTVIQLSQVEGEYATKSLALAPGEYIFEVTNTEVDKDLGFYLQDETDAQVENSGLEALIGQGETSRTGVVTLAPGSYNYSCPLNPTPHYRITVR